NKQSRGAFGQARMEAIVQDGMPSGSYQFQYTLSSGKRPDCVVFLPDQRPLCIDAKFPLEAMTALHDARSDEEKKFATQRLRDAADQIRTEVLNLGDDLGRLRERVLKLQKHFGDVNEDVRQILISADKIEKRAGRIEELDFSKTDAPAEAPRIVQSATSELFPAPRKLQAGE